MFRKAGNIIRADVAHGYDGRSRGFGSVLFATPEDAKTAICKSLLSELAHNAHLDPSTCITFRLAY